MSALMVHYDGDYSSPVQVAPWAEEVDNTTQSISFRAPFQQITGAFRRAPFSLSGPSGSWLVEETNGSIVGADILQWERTFAQVPPSRSEYEGHTHGYQTVQTVDGKTSLGEIAIPVTSRLQFDYFYLPSGLYSTPADIPILQAYRLIMFAPDQILFRGTFPGGAPEIVAEDSVVTRWRGSIYQRMTRHVPSPTFTVLT